MQARHGEGGLGYWREREGDKIRRGDGEEDRKINMKTEGEERWGKRKKEHLRDSFKTLLS